jgi:uncharacterized protein YbjT (DUF2867 family)
MPQTVLVTGASGFIGSRLTAALAADGHRVRAMTRRPADYAGAGHPVHGDVHDPAGLAAALRGVETAYYLVHSLDVGDFEKLDAEAALNFGGAAAEAGVGRIVYLGGLGTDDDGLSTHLRSRRQVEQLLRVSGVALTVLRAAVVVGHGGISWEITRQLAARLPMMITPRGASTRTQPIAVSDVVRYLVGVLDAPQAAGRVFEIGGPEVLTYTAMIQRAALVQGHQILNLTLPLPMPPFAGDMLARLTHVDATTARNLVGSMSNEVVVRNRSIRRVVPGRLIGYDDAVRMALAERALSRG